MGMQSHRGCLDWNYKLQLTPSLSLKLETLDVSEDGEPEAGSVDCLCKLWVTPLPCSCCVDNAHSCLGRWPPNSPWYLWLKFQKRYSRQNPVLLSEGQEQPHFLLTVDWFTQSVSKYQLQRQHQTHTQSLPLAPSLYLSCKITSWLIFESESRSSDSSYIFSTFLLLHKVIPARNCLANTGEE